MTDSQIVGFILLIIGGLEAVRPDIFIRFQIWSQRVIMGARYEPSRRTYMIVRILGSVFIVIGLMALAGIIK